MSSGPVWKIEFYVPTAQGEVFADALDPFVGALSFFAIEGTGETRIMAYGAETPDEAATVSYTHLTLPTTPYV